MAWKRVLTCALSVLFVCAGVSSARGGEILFSIRDGRVTLVARDALLSDILAVWEREGRTTIVARERVQGMVASLELRNEPESTALTTILRSVTGFIAAKHAVPPRDGSTYRCIIINPAPAPVMVAQAGPPGRTTPALPAQTPPPQMGMPPSMLGNPGMFPPAMVPSQADDADDGGASQGLVPGGLRQPGMMSPVGMPRPPFDTSTGVEPASRYAQPAQTPGFPGAGVGIPGAVVPVPTPAKPPGTTVQPGQKPPGLPPSVS